MQTPQEVAAILPQARTPQNYALFISILPKV